MSQIKNDLLLRALRGEIVERPPVWMMRQAGRYLPDYLKLKAKYDFFTRVQTPELATAITLQPVDQVGVDAAIIFCDILVIPQAMGLEVLMEEGKGPSLPKVIQTQQDIDALITEGVEESLKYVYDALSLTKKELNGRTPLIGFAGAPWTILCYMVEGKGSKTWDKAKQFAYTQPALAHQLLQKITTITIQYLKLQAKAGADTVQVFDSWAGVMPSAEFDRWCLAPVKSIIDGVRAIIPGARIIAFPRGAGSRVPLAAEALGAQVIGLDTAADIAWTAANVTKEIALQGNLDPLVLVAGGKALDAAVDRILLEMQSHRHIFNLGHGIVPATPIAHVDQMLRRVRQLGQER